MNELRDFAHLSTACSLCKRCMEICPVKIPLDELIIENRNLINTRKVGNSKMDMLVRVMIWHCNSRKRMDSPLFVKKLEMKRFLSPQTWGDRRVMPEFAPKTFSQMWRETEMK